MQGYNVIAVYDSNDTKLLMCRRRKNPYKGLLNLVGGKIEQDEDSISAAYRELQEETAIGKRDITLTHLMDFTYHMKNCIVEVYFGTLNKQVEVFGDENDLIWIDFNHDFFDMSQFAGDGNMGHILEQVKIAKAMMQK